MQILVSKCEANSIFAQFGQHIRQGQSREALEFVDVDKEIATLGRWGVGPAESGKSNRRDEQSTKKRRTVFADVPLRQIYQEHLAFVHNPTDVQIPLGSGQYPIEHGISQKCSNLVLDWCRSVGAVAEGEPLKFFQ
jgi:hypothetical protein